MLTFAVIACGPSTEGEKKKWESHKKNAATYKTEYAGMATVIDTNLKAAETAMTEALKVKDEEKKAKAMQSANGIAKKVVGRISEIKSKISGLESDIKKLNKLKLPASKAGTRDNAVSSGFETISSVNKALASAAPKTVEEAEAVLKEQVDALISANSSVDRAYNAVKPKKKKKKKKRKKN